MRRSFIHLVVVAAFLLTAVSSPFQTARAANQTHLRCHEQRIGAGFQTWTVAKLCHAAPPARLAQRRPVVHAPSHVGYQVSVLVTYYLATGSPMASGRMPYIGAIACGWDFPMFARVFIPGLGTFTCEDRIGYRPFQHVDVYGIPLGTGYRTVTVF